MLMTLAIIDCVLIVFYVMNSAVIGSMQPLGPSINYVISFSKYFELFLPPPCHHFFTDTVRTNKFKTLTDFRSEMVLSMSVLRSYVLKLPTYLFSNQLCFPESLVENNYGIPKYLVFSIAMFFLCYKKVASPFQFDAQYF